MPAGHSSAPGAPALVVVEFVDIGQPIGEELRVADPFE